MSRCTEKSSSRLWSILPFALAVFICASRLSAAQPASSVDFSISAQPLSTALIEFSKQANIQVLTAGYEIEGVAAPGITGRLTLDGALVQMLKGSGFTYRFVDARTLILVKERETRGQPASRAGNAEQTTLAAHLARAGTEPPAQSHGNTGDPAETVAGDGTPEILVRNSRLLNMDIPRSRDDAQPYVIFDRSRIERSGAVNLQDFLKQRLPMNTVGITDVQQNSTNGSMSKINLRGLGANQTLILIDGHRPAPANNSGGSIAQPSLNGIPLAAVERIEVLASTASGIYGGSATGGVVNIVLRRDYAGAEVKVTYENTYDSDVAMRNVDFSSGFSLGSKTNILLAGSYQDNNSLLLRDRPFYAHGVARILANSGNNYQAFNIGGDFPPAGATPNIRSADGTNLVLKSNLMSLNSPSTFVSPGYAGPSADAGAALVANAGKYNLALANTAQNGFGGLQSLLSQPATKSLMATVRQEFTPNLQVFVDLGWSDSASHYNTNFLRSDYFIPASATTNPFTNDLFVMLPLPYAHRDQLVEYTDWRAVGGLIFRLPARWQGETDYTWSRSRRAFFAPGPRRSTLAAGVGNGTLDVLRDLDRFPLALAPFAGPDQFITPLDLTLKNTTLRLSGPVGSLPGGAPVVSIMLERRDEHLSDGFFNNILPTLSFYFPEQSQKTNGAYAEVRLPLVGQTNNMPWVRELELQVAARYDDYTMDSATGTLTVGVTTPVDRSVSKKTSTNPTVGLRYQPLDYLTVRGSYGKGFLPPTFSQVLPTFTSVSFNIVDPLRGNTRYGVPPGPNSLQGGNPNVQPESSESWSAGVILTPRVLQGLRLSLDWVRIDKSDNIVNLGQQTIVNNEVFLPARVLRNPLSAADQAAGFTGGVITAIDATAVNLAKAFIEAYDVALDYTLDTSNAGAFEIYALATRQTHLKNKILPTAPLVERAGITAANPLKFKANFGVNWNRESWTLGWLTSYFDSYYVADPSAASSAPIFAQQGARKINSQSYHDMFFVYRFAATAGGGRLSSLLGGTEVQLGLKNVFNTEPPFDVAQSSTGYYSPYGDPLMGRYYLSLRRNF